MTIRNNLGYIFVLGLFIMFILIGIAAVIAAVTKSSLQFTNYFGWIGNLTVLFIAIIFVILAFWFIGMLYRHYGGYYPSNHWDWWDHDDAMDIFRETYAKGEITKEQYNQMMDDLERRGK